MAIVNSVLGPLETADLGFTLMHEHLLVASAGGYENYPELLGTDRMQRVVQELKMSKVEGIDTIVDATTLDLGRNVEMLAEASRRSGVNIVACAGWWLETPRFFTGVCSDQWTEVFTREIQEGIAGTGIKAGILDTPAVSAPPTMASYYA